MTNRRKAIADLFLASALGLFVELVFIRWVASELRFFSFYKNVALIAAYLGMGLGFVTYKKEPQARSLQRSYLPMMGLIVVVVLALGRTPLSDLLLSSRSYTQEYLWGGYIGELVWWMSVLLEVVFYGTLLGMFLLLTVVFVPLGRLIAAKFSVFRPLTGYTVNILGSLAGVLAYTGMSFLGWPPPTWFLVGALGLMYFIPRSPRGSWWTSLVLAGIPVLLTFIWPTPALRTVWSPYYRIDIREDLATSDPGLLLGYDLSVNLAYHQRLVNLSPSFVAENREAAPEHFDSAQAEYDAPYAAAPSLRRVLVVGAGTGNDVAAALRAGAMDVTAVEIDPMILRLGEELHPERPYANEAVQLVAEDARSFFSRARGSYDLIVFGALDSHTLFSTASSVRLDNFVYTHESLARVRELLSEGGLLALSFGVPQEIEWMGLRLYRTLTDAFGHAPKVYEFPSHNILFLIGREPTDVYEVHDPRVLSRPDYTYRADIVPTTDDWPYLYLRDRTVPPTYLIALAGMAVISLVFIRGGLPSFKRLKPDLFFLGAAFFLLETKSVTEMALLFGSTWVVNAAVISAILLMIVLANIAVERLNLRRTWLYYVLLGVSLVASFFLPVRTFLGLPVGLRTVLASLEQAAPLFFAAIVFAIRFREQKSIPEALGSNLLGGVLGGLTEYASLALGIRSLYILALGGYILSALPLERDAEP